MKIQVRFLTLICAGLLCLCFVTPALAAEYTGVINTDDVFFRAQPNTDAVFYWRLDKDTKVTVTDTKGDFYAVTIDKTKGYVMKKFVTLSSSDAAKLNAKTSAYSSATSISQLGSMPAATGKGDSGTAVEKLQQALKIKKFYTGTVDGIYGANTEKAVLAYQKSEGLSQTGKANSATLSRLWGKTTADKTTTASATTTSSTGRDTSLSQIPVPNPCKKGDSGNDVKYLQRALKLRGYYSGSIDGNFGENTEKAVIAFQKASSLSRDGIAGKVTICALFKLDSYPTTNKTTTTTTTTTTSSSLKTERLDWFNVDHEKVIPRGSTFTVKDVKTGKTFQCRRWAGANHLDAEPLTANDTAVMKALYGGTWSWARRAILVKYNGHVYAASMNGMPHGTSTISGNNFGGHFCIHFYNSKTHESKKVDSQHQSAVATAMNAKW